MRNSLMDLNNHLFEAMERLNDDELQGDALEAELKRSDALSKVAGQIISNGQLMVRAHQVRSETYGAGGESMPQTLLGGGADGR